MFFFLGFVRFLRFGFSSCSYCAFVFSSAQSSRDFDVDSGMNLVSGIPIFIFLRFLVSVVLVSWNPSYIVGHFFKFFRRCFLVLFRSFDSGFVFDLSCLTSGFFPPVPSVLFVVPSVSCELFLRL